MKRCFMLTEGSDDMPVRMERRGRLILSRLGPLFLAFVFFVLPFLAHGGKGKEHSAKGMGGRAKRIADDARRVN